MKNIHIYIIGLFTMIGCNSEPPVIEKALVCIIDGTDTSIHKPSFSEIKPFLKLSNNDNGLNFKAKVIGDIEFGNSFEKSLSPKIIVDETAEERFFETKKFLRNLRAGYDKLTTRAITKEHSIIYRVVVDELNRLSSSTAKEKIILINSDLMENSDDLNLYKPSDLYKLMNSPYKIEEKLTIRYRLKDLKGIQVHFLFEPQNFQQNSIYREILKCYTSIITKAGGTCIVGSNLDISSIKRENVSTEFLN